MKKLLLALLAVASMAGAYVLGTLNASKTISIPPAQWAQGSESAQAWREFVASLESAGARVFAATDEPQERLEGISYLAQLATASLEMKFAKGDHVAPSFTDWMSNYRKFLGDSPDAIYHTAEISSEFDYEITGNIAEAEYLGFMLYGRSLNGWNRAAANISHEAMAFDESGNFTIILSVEKPEDSSANWLALEEDIHMVMVRQYYHGRAGKQHSRFTIRNLSQPDVVEKTDEEVAKGLANAATFFNETVDGAIALAGMVSSAANDIDPPKTYNPDFGGVFYPTLDNDYYGSWVYLEDDEALIIEGEVPDALYWSISLQNRWMQSLDYANNPVALNDGEIEVNDGRYKVIVSHRKPPTGNWLSTAGTREGLLAIRYLRSEDSSKPTLTLVKFAELSQ